MGIISLWTQNGELVYVNNQSILTLFLALITKL